MKNPSQNPGGHDGSADLACGRRRHHASVDWRRRWRFSRSRLALGGLVVAVALLVTGSASAQMTTERVRVACVGEATTHSAHRNYDPEYPELMGQFLEDDFATDTTQMNPMSGGMLYGEGSTYRVGNFGVPKGSALIHADNDKAEATLNSTQLTLAEQFEPDLVIIGPYGPHEPYAGVPISNFAADYRQLVERVESFSSSPAVLICSPLPRDAVDNNTERRQIREDTVRVAADMGIGLIDLWPEFLDHAGEFEDQNHLNLQGRQHMARIVGEAVELWQRDVSDEEPGPDPSPGGMASDAGAGGTLSATGGTGPAPSSGGSAGADDTFSSGGQGGALVAAPSGNAGRGGGDVNTMGPVTSLEPDPEPVATTATTASAMPSGAADCAATGSDTAVPSCATSEGALVPPPADVVASPPLALDAEGASPRVPPVGEPAASGSGCTVLRVSRPSQSQQRTIQLVALRLAVLGVPLIIWRRRAARSRRRSPRRTARQ
jgi:hypothetical protein